MKISMKSTIAASLIAASTLTAGSVSAQVSGIATADPTIAIARTKALAAGYTQVRTTYSSYITQIDGKNKEITVLQKQLDTNNDNQITDAELKAAQAAKHPAVQSIVTKQNEINKLREPIVMAQYFVIQNITAKYEAAQQSVVAAKRVSIIVTPDALVWAPKTADITDAIVAQLDASVPTVATAPPAQWRPTRQTAAIHQQIQKLLIASARVQAAQAAANRPAAQPQGR